MNVLHSALAAIAAISVIGCSSAEQNQPVEDNNRSVSSEPLLTLLAPSETGVDFANSFVENAEINYRTCPYCYNGGGVAVGDVNNDGLPDIYFTSNLEDNKLYLNQGNLKFEDITMAAGVEGGADWSAGATMADVNGDGWLDIYVCKSVTEYSRGSANLLYINNGDLTFTERAREYGLADEGFATQAAFFDYDLDNDLDMFLINHPGKSEPGLTKAETIKLGKNPLVRDKLFRNDGDTFSDVTFSAGIMSGYTYGLSVTVGDLDNDGWPDVYVGNDYVGRDYLYMNNGDGTFTESLEQRLKHIPNFSMGADIADYNNDGLLDIVVLDMVAEDYYRSRVLMGAMRPRLFWKLVNEGYHYQFMGNMLQLNNGNGSFSEIAQFAGIAKTDWSWSPLFADLDNDGLKDLLVTNGIMRDIRHNDHLEKMVDAFGDVANDDPDLVAQNLDLILSSPSTKVKNYAFRNNGDYTLSKTGDEWGFNRASFSFGAAYADLDRDGDLDIVVNNVNEAAFVFRNNAHAQTGNNFLRVELQGMAGNTQALGATIRLVNNGETQFQDITATRGYQSSSETIAHFGVGTSETIESIEVVWPDGRSEVLRNVKTNQSLVVRYANASVPPPASGTADAELFTEVDLQRSGVTFAHKENEHDDFFVEILLPHKQSQNGPGIAVGDANGDGIEDFYVGGAVFSSGELFIQTPDGRFKRSQSRPWAQDKNCEDLGALFFDADGDGDNDLYVVSGGNEYYPGSAELQDRLYLNDGRGAFSKSAGWLPEMRASGSVVTAGDYDNDGDLDLFVGGRIVPTKYPYPARSYLLRNTGTTFEDVTLQIAPELFEPGLATAALWSDFDTDGALDLIVVGEWMPIGIYKNTGAVFRNVSADLGIQSTIGWWSSIVGGDFDDDGDTDYIAGNLGMNNKYRPTPKKPLHIFCSDFDNSGVLDIVLAKVSGDKLLPVRGRECSSEQMPFILQKFPTYHDFAVSTLEEVYGVEALEQALHYQATTFYSSYIRNDGDAGFTLVALPERAQFGPLYGSSTVDVDADGKLDVVMVGNFYGSEVETVRHDAHIGVALKGDGAGGFTTLDTRTSGFFVPGDAKSMALIYHQSERSLMTLIGINNARPQAFTMEASGKSEVLFAEPDDRYALIHFSDGRKRKHEFTYGSGYLSQSSRALVLTGDVQSVEFVTGAGARRSVTIDAVSFAN